MAMFKGSYLFPTIISGIHVSFQGCNITVLYRVGRGFSTSSGLGPSSRLTVFSNVREYCDKMRFLSQQRCILYGHFLAASFLNCLAPKNRKGIRIVLQSMFLLRVHGQGVHTCILYINHPKYWSLGRNPPPLSR